ncbi:hypothetical protein Tco_0048720 [Tanacetum coccineum]
MPPHRDTTTTPPPSSPSTPNHHHKGVFVFGTAGSTGVVVYVIRKPQGPGTVGDSRGVEYSSRQPGGKGLLGSAVENSRGASGLWDNTEKGAFAVGQPGIAGGRDVGFGAAGT